MTAVALESRRRRVEAAFTVDHFREWALRLELDNGEPWEVEEFFLAFLEDYFAGTPENWLVVPEGNTKTTSLAGLAVYLLEHRALAGIPWAAASRDQAEIGYRQAEGFVLRSTRLRQVLKCQEGYRRIKNLQTAGRIQVFAADDKTGDGIIPTDAFLDELHRQKDLSLYRTWRGKLLKRGGQMATISTAGEPGSEFEETRELIRCSVPCVERRPGFVLHRSPQIAFHEYAVPADADVDDLEVVKAANPFSGLTVDALRFKRETPTMTLQHWKRFVCNIATREESSAVQEAEWSAACLDGEDAEIPAGEAIWVGLDVGWKWDTTAIVPLWVRDDGVRVLGESVVLTPPRDSSSLHPDELKRALIGLRSRNPVHTVVMDMARAEDVAAWIDDELGAIVVDRGQGNAMAALDYERFMEGLRSGALRHVGDPALTSHVLNAVVRELPAGGARFDRPSRTRQGGNQARRVIDGLVAAAMANTAAAADEGDFTIY